MIRFVTCCIALLLVSPTLASVVDLYDASVDTLPGSQGGLTYFGLGEVSQTSTSNGTEFTTDLPAQAGYSAVDVELDPSTGFSIDFALQVIDEEHVSNDRAGFSVIALGNDVRGLELAFWEDEIWVQDDSPLFTHAEGISYDTTSGQVDYRLAIVGSTYELFANGNSLLTGSTRDYTPFTGLIDPYETPNFLFFGDDTSRASASVRLGDISVELCDCENVPEPRCAAGWLLIVGVLLGRRARQK